MQRGRRLLVAATALAVAFGAFAPAAGARPRQDPPPAEGEVVHSWALAPTGTSADPSQPGNRPTFSYELEPGAVVEDSVTLFNYSSVPLNFDLYATDAFNNEDGAFDVLPAAEEPTDVGTWVELPTDIITVQANQQATFPITVRVPSDASAGDHVGAILASNTALGTGADGKVVELDRRTGSRVYIRVAGDLNPELAIENVSTTYEPSLNPMGGTAKVSYRIQNRGNVRLSGRHSVSVSGPFGLFEKSSDEEDLPELLPGEGMTVEREFEDVPAAVIEQTKVRLEPSTEVGGEQDLDTVTRRGFTFAPPLTILFLAVATWLALRARRAYRRHRTEERVTAGAGAS